LAASLRMFGMRAVADTQSRGLAAALEWREALGARNLLHLNGSGRTAWAPANGRVRRLPTDQVVGRLATLTRGQGSPAKPASRGGDVGGVPGEAGGGGRVAP